MEKVKVSTVWLGACAGCHMSFLDLDEGLIDLFEKIEIIHSPITDIKDFPKVTLGIVEGAIVNEENLEVLKNLRESCDILVALGDCACFGGIPAMRNFWDKEEILKRAYIDTESTINMSGNIPHIEVPELFHAVKPIDAYVRVDGYIPGCPPRAGAIGYALGEILKGNMPHLPKEILAYD